MTNNKVADTALGLSWIGLFLAHNAEINEILKTILYVTSIIATIIAAYCHLKRATR